MGGKRRAPVFAENFSRNLDALRLFWGSRGNDAFQRLLDRLFDDIAPTLRLYPRAGRNFLEHPLRSEEARRLLGKLKGVLKKGDELREFVMDDYLVLYLLRGRRTIFLSIKHHRQISFDLRRFWS